MHPRNPYRDGVDFASLASKYPPLRSYVNSRTGSIDFTDPKAQRALTKAILRTDFGLDVDLPEDRLCPPVPNRLNYVLWIEDVVEAMTRARARGLGLGLGLEEGGEKVKEEKEGSGVRVRGLDVGTGASAIYPLLCCKRNPTWEMLATEIDSTSLACAQRNVSHNALDGRIQISLATFPSSSSPPSSSSSPCPPSSSKIFGPLFADPHLRVDFTTCNPPFYSSAEDIRSSKEEKDGDAFSVCTGSVGEMIYAPGPRPPYSTSSSSTPNLGVSSTMDASSSSTGKYAECEREGGEVGFVARMVEESLVIGERCGWYTSMLGKMSSVPKIVGLLKSVGITNYAITQFVQGQTRRWAVGWSVGQWWRLPDTIARLSHLPSSHLLSKVQPPRTTLEYPMNRDPRVVLRGVLEGMRVDGVLEVEEKSKGVLRVGGRRLSSLEEEEAKEDKTMGEEREGEGEGEGKEERNGDGEKGVEWVVRAKENTWSRAARRKLRHAQPQNATFRERDGERQGCEGTGEGVKRRRVEGDEGGLGERVSKKPRSSSPDPSSSSSHSPSTIDFKMICNVTVAASPERDHDDHDGVKGEGDERDEGRAKWVMRVQWIYGKDEDREMFEGFGRHVGRKVSEGVR